MRRLPAVFSLKDGTLSPKVDQRFVGHDWGSDPANLANSICCAKLGPKQQLELGFGVLLMGASSLKNIT